MTQHRENTLVEICFTKQTKYNKTQTQNMLSLSQSAITNIKQKKTYFYNFNFFSHKKSVNYATIFEETFFFLFFFFFHSNFANKKKFFLNQ